MKISKQHIHKNKYLLVLLSLLNFLLTPVHVLLFSSFPSLVVVINFSLVILAGLGICKENKHKIIYYISAAIILFMIWLEFGSVERTSIHVLRLVASLVFFSFLCFLMIKNLVSSKYFDIQNIIGAVAGYLFIGLIGGMIFEFIDVILPGSFVNSGNRGGYTYYYFSFISITTVGYGDITPITPQAQSITLIMNIIGQFYLAIVVALFVGKYLNRK